MTAVWLSMVCPSAQATKRTQSGVIKGRLAAAGSHTTHAVSQQFTDVSAMAFSWVSLHCAVAFLSPSNGFDFRQFRSLPVGTVLNPMAVDGLLKLGHQALKVFLASVQDLAQLRAGLHGLRIGITSPRQKRKVFNEGRSAAGKLVQRVGVRGHVR